METLNRNLDFFKKIASYLTKEGSALNDNVFEAKFNGIIVRTGESGIIYHSTMQNVYKIAQKYNLVYFVSTDLKGKIYLKIH